MGSFIKHHHHSTMLLTTTSLSFVFGWFHMYKNRERAKENVHILEQMCDRITGRTGVDISFDPRPTFEEMGYVFRALRQQQTYLQNPFYHHLWWPPLVDWSQCPLDARLGTYRQ